MTALITRDELRAEIEAGTVTVVDALPESNWAQQHLPGALNLVEDDVAAHASALLPDKGAAIVTYCSNGSAGTARQWRPGSSNSATATSASTATASKIGCRPACPPRGFIRRKDLQPGER